MTGAGRLAQQGLEQTEFRPFTVTTATGRYVWCWSSRRL